MLQSIIKMLSYFETENIKYCHWKSNEHIQESLNGDTDLDMIFNPSQRREIEIILDRCGLKRFRATTLMQYNAIEDFIGFDKETAKIWHLHLHYRLTIGEKHLKGYTLPWTEYLLNRRSLDETGAIYCSNPIDEHLLLLIRMALKLRWRDYGKKIGRDDIAELNWLEERTNNDEIIATAQKLLSEDFVKETRKLLECNLENENQLFKLQRILRKDLKIFSSYNKATSYLKRSQRELFWFVGGVKRRIGWSSTTANRRISPSGGSVIAILGCDGAGKSTSISYMEKEFGKKLDVYNTYLGSGDGSSSLLRKPMKLVARRVGGKGLGQVVNKELDSGRKISLKSRLYSYAKIFWAVALAAKKKKKIKKITRARNNGLLVLVDRYPQIEIPGYGDGPLLTRYLEDQSGVLKKIADWEFEIYKSAYNNPPDLLVKLMVPTEIAILRKPEMTAEEIENKKVVVRKIQMSGNSVEIDTFQEMKVSLGQVMYEIWKVI